MTRPDITIRPAVRADMAVVAEMMAESEAYLGSLDGSGSDFDAAAARVKLERCGFGERPLFACALLEADGAPIGHAVYCIGFWADGLVGTLFLSDLYVREDWRSQGLGARLMAHLAEVGRAAGCECIMWTVWEKNERAQRFYRRLGAEAMDEERLMSWRIDL